VTALCLLLFNPRFSAESSEQYLLNGAANQIIRESNSMFSIYSYNAMVETSTTYGTLKDLPTGSFRARLCGLAFDFPLGFANNGEGHDF
jgi:hypothetical protein